MSPIADVGGPAPDRALVKLVFELEDLLYSESGVETGEEVPADVIDLARKIDGKLPYDAEIRFCEQILVDIGEVVDKHPTSFWTPLHLKTKVELFQSRYSQLLAFHAKQP